jgi:hypothetical protein
MFHKVLLSAQPQLEAHCPWPPEIGPQHIDNNSLGTRHVAGATQKKNVACSISDEVIEYFPICLTFSAATWPLDLMSL